MSEMPVSFKDHVRESVSQIMSEVLNKHLTNILQEWAKNRFMRSIQLRTRLGERRLSRRERNILIKKIRASQRESATAYRQAREMMGIE